MLKKVLSKEQCAKCRGCCFFDEDEDWIYPYLTKAESEKARELGVLTKKLGEDVFRFEKIYCKEKLFRCRALGDNGCVLGDFKPIACRYYPLVITEISGKTAIALDTYCGAFDKNEDALGALLDGGLAKTLFEYAKAHPQNILPYSQRLKPLRF